VTLIVNVNGALVAPSGSVAAVALTVNALPLGVGGGFGDRLGRAASS
jgi:hypothetical protein